MTPLSLNIPIVNNPDSTEEPKVGNDLITIQTFGNSLGAARRLLLTGSGCVQQTAQVNGAGDYIFMTDGTVVKALGGGAFAPHMWLPDAGLSSQPTDFQVTGMTSKARIRGVVATNSIAPVLNIVLGLYQITSFSGINLTYNLSSVVSGSTVTQNTPSASTIYQLESGEFTLPTAGGPCVVGFHLSAQPASTSQMAVSIQLYGYNV